MAVKHAYDTDQKIIYVTLAPTFDGVNWVVEYDVKTDLYSDTKEDMTTLLDGFKMPVASTGGDDLPGDKALGATFFLEYGWRIKPYESDHVFRVNGNLYTREGDSPFVQTDGIYNVMVESTVSSITEAISTDAAGYDVWDEPTSEHKIPGTYGAEVATKADIAASSSTVENHAISGTAIYGSVVSGDYTSMLSRDGSYWQIAEDAVNGITVETVFNLPDADSKPGVVSVFGRYTGFPALTHHIELYAYNYESVSWEELNEEFLPGGVTSDALYTHEYYERHIDRDNSNEVKIRFVHHTTTYNDTHRLYLDYMDVSSIDVITAADMADAVWAEDMTTQTVPNSAATALRSTVYRVGNITLNTVGGTAGTGWPIGSHFKPSDNLTDSLTLMFYGNITELILLSSVTIEASHDVSGKIIKSLGRLGTAVTLAAGNTANKTTFMNVDLSGVSTVGNELLIYDSSIGNLESFKGIMNNVTFAQGSEISFDTWATIIQATAGGEPTNEPEFSINGASVNISHWTGNLKIMNKTGANRTVINCTSGNIIIDASCTAGTIQLLGIGVVEDNSGPGCQVDTDAFVGRDSIADAVLDELILEHQLVGSLGYAVQSILGLTQSNYTLSDQVYVDINDIKYLASATMNTYEDSINAAAGTNAIRNYSITAGYNGTGDLTTYKVVEQ